MTSTNLKNTAANNVSVKYGALSIKEFNTALAKQDSSTMYGILALVHGQASDLVDGRIIKTAAFGTDKATVGTALATLADDIFGFDSVNGTNKPEQKHNAQIKRCAIVAAYLMDGFVGVGLDERVRLSAKGNKLQVAGRFLIEDTEDADYDSMLTINGSRGRALSDLSRAAIAWNKKATATTGNATAQDDSRKKKVSELAGSAAGQAKLADILTEEVAKAEKKGEKLNKDLAQALGNLKAQIASAQISKDGDTDSDILLEVEDISNMVAFIDKHDSAIQQALYNLYVKLDVAFGQNPQIVTECELANERNAA